MTELADIVRGILELEPAAPAMEFDGRWRTWGDLAHVVAGLESAFTTAGVNAGGRIGLLLRNHPLMAAALLGVVASDRCVVTLNPSLPEDRLAGDIVATKPAVLVCLARDWERPAVRRAAEQVGCVGLILSDDGTEPVAVVPGLDAIHGQYVAPYAPGIAIEMLTSGTTGAPKRIPLRAEAFARSVLDAGVFEGRPRDAPPRLSNGVQIIVAPFAHIAGVFALFTCIVGGRKSCLLERFAVDVWADAVRRHKPRVASAPPSALRMILDAKVPREHLASLSAFRTGTAPLDPDLADEFFEQYGLRVLQNYGATEFAGGVAGWTLEDHKARYAEKRGAVGRLNPGVEGRVVDRETFDVLPPGEEGLLELKAPQLGDGKTWLRTTDLAVVDEDRFLWIKGRFDNAIIRGGFKILPDDVVRALEQHPAILEAAVVGLRNDRLGETPAAAYLVRAGRIAPSEDQLREFLRARLLPYQIPSHFMQVSELPRTPSLKVSQIELKALFADAR